MTNTDLIDFTSPSNGGNNDYISVVKAQLLNADRTEVFLKAFPCIEKGLFRITLEGMSEKLYFLYRVISTDPENFSYKMEIKPFRFINWKDSKIWCNFFPWAEVEIAITEACEVTTKVTIGSYTMEDAAVDAISEISQKNALLGIEKKNGSRTFDMISEAKKLCEEVQTTEMLASWEVKELPGLDRLMGSIIVVNTLIEMQKEKKTIVSTVSTEKKPTESAPVIYKEAEGRKQESPRRVKRIYSDLTIISERPPRKLKARRKITMSSWSVRGHLRHYKNGRIVHIAPYQKGKGKGSEVNEKPITLIVK